MFDDSSNDAKYSAESGYPILPSALASMMGVSVNKLNFLSDKQQTGWVEKEDVARGLEQQRTFNLFKNLEHLSSSSEGVHTAIFQRLII